MGSNVPPRRLIAPSILSADFARLGDEVAHLADAGADFIHVDVMDGHFVPNLTIGAPVVRALRAVTKLPLDVHLMIDEPSRFVDDFARAGADYLTVHVEACRDPAGTLMQIRAAGVRPGITLRPGTDVAAILPLLPLADMVLIMTVEPGFGGQKFMPGPAAKVDVIRAELLKIKSTALIEVDGGITEQTARLVGAADVLVAGSFVFADGSYAANINRLRNAR